MKPIDYKSKMDNFWRFGRQWQIFRLLVRYERDDGSRTDWQPALDRNKDPIVYIPVEPMMPVT